jgi:drug/metabolite transporter (DMT)-like permease
MKSIVYALIGICMYAVQNVIIDVKLKQYSTATLLMSFYIVLLPLGAGLFFYQKMRGQQVIVPDKDAVLLIAAVAAMFFFADFFYIGAYTKGGNAVTITILAVLMPVLCAVMKFLWVREIPTRYHFIGFLFAALAITFVAVGNSKKPVEISKSSEAQEVVSLK